MRRRATDVQQASSGVAAAPQELDEPDERRLRGVGAHVEHRLGGEEPADRDAVEPAREAVVVPRLDRVRPAELVQPLVCGLDDPGVDPARRVARTRAAETTSAKAVSTRIS